MHTNKALMKGEEGRFQSKFTGTFVHFTICSIDCRYEQRPLISKNVQIRNKITTENVGFIQWLDEVNTITGVNRRAGLRGAHLAQPMSEASGSTRSSLSPLAHPKHFIHSCLQKPASYCSHSNVQHLPLVWADWKDHMEVREISHGSSPMILRGSRCWWEYFVTVSGNGQSPIHTWAIRSETQPSRSCPDPSAVHINVRLHQSPTHPPSQVFFYLSLSLSNLYKCHFIMHLSSLGLFSPTFPPRCPPLCSDSARLFFSFHLDSIIPLLFQVILRESFLLSSSLRNHTIGLATSVSF